MSVEITCQWCQKQFFVRASRAKRQKFCSKTCTDASFKVRFTGKNNPAYGQVYRTKATHPDWANQIADTQRNSGKMLGDANPMRRSDVASKMSKTRREKVTSNPEYLKQSSERMCKAWTSGKYDDVRTGRCKWFTHTLPDGQSVKLQGTWEVVLARHLDSLKIAYDAHSGRISYVDREGTNRSYYPDFYVPSVDCYLDVKGDYFDSLQKSKFDDIRLSNPDMKLIIVNRGVFSDWGIDVLTLSRAVSKKE